MPEAVVWPAPEIDKNLPTAKLKLLISIGVVFDSWNFDKVNIKWVSVVVVTEAIGLLSESKENTVSFPKLDCDMPKFTFSGSEGYIVSELNIFSPLVML